MKYGTEEEFAEAIHLTFTPEVVGNIVPSLDKAYLSALENFDIRKGSNEGTFGYDVYNFVRHELIEFSRGAKSSMLLKSKAPLFRMRIEHFELSAHRVGDHENQDIRKCFPNTDGPAHYKYKYDPSTQLALPEIFEEQKKNSIPFNIVLAHQGNHENGLRAIYVCRPGKVANGKIISWEFVHRLWVIGEDISNPTSVLAPPEEIVKKPIVQRKKKDSDNSVVNTPPEKVSNIEIKIREKKKLEADG